MIVSMSFKVEWNKKGGENLQQFKARYHKFRAHVEQMQMSGLLPIGEIYWIKKMADPDPKPPLPEVVHVMGEHLDD
jgi:hypothetical protein